MLGRTVSHYRIVRQLGAGGMGVVYEAEDTRLGRSVAVKFLSSQLAQDAPMLERWERRIQNDTTKFAALGRPLKATRTSLRPQCA